MRTSSNPLDLWVPRNKTALMQHLQLLVGREAYRNWCGGMIDRKKLPGFAAKMAQRYPIMRNTRGRSYDRKCGKAVVHLIIFPVGEKVQWWLISDDGSGGLADPSAEDAKVTKDAMTADGHITFGDYVLLYASKREYRKLTSDSSSKTKGFYKDLSTWTWKMRGEVVRELRASIEECCTRLQLGTEGEAHQQSRGLKGLLATMRRRPLFSGIRNQVYDLHSEAKELWRRHHGAWCARQGSHQAALADDTDAELMLAGKPFPKMRRIRVFDIPPATIRQLCTDDVSRQIADGGEL